MNNKIQQYLVPISIVVAGALVAVGIFFGGGKAPSNPTVAGAPGTVDIKDVKTSGEPMIGNPKAKVTIAYWSDYQCPYCKQFETTTMQDVLTNYVNTNKVKIVFKDFQFLGQYSKIAGRDDSMTAALMARAVWDQQPDKYFAWREAMFNAQDDENIGFGTEDDVIALTKTISGLDANKVIAVYGSKKPEYQAQIDADRAEATKFGIDGTPGFILGNQLLSGALPYANVSAILDAELK